MSSEEYGSAKLVDEALKRRNKAQIAKSFIKSSNGVQIIKGIQDEVSALLNELVGTRLDHEQYIEKRAEVACLRRLLKGWESDSLSVERYEQMYKQRQEDNARRIQLEQSTKA